MRLNQTMVSLKKMHKFLMVSMIGLTLVTISLLSSCAKYITISSSTIQSPPISQPGTTSTLPTSSYPTSFSTTISTTVSSQTPVIKLTETINHTLTKLNIKTEPSPGEFLYDTFSRYSGVILQEVEVDKYYADKDIDRSNFVIKKGGPILVVIGGIQNKHKDYPWVLMWAYGYDVYGKQLAWTYDPVGPGDIRLEVPPERTERFTLHLNYSENIEIIRIYAQTLNMPPP